MPGHPRTSIMAQGKQQQPPSQSFTHLEQQLQSKNKLSMTLCLENKSLKQDNDYQKSLVNLKDKQLFSLQEENKLIISQLDEKTNTERSNPTLENEKQIKALANQIQKQKSLTEEQINLTNDQKSIVKSKVQKIHHLSREVHLLKSENQTLVNLIIQLKQSKIDIISHNELLKKQKERHEEQCQKVTTQNKEMNEKYQESLENIKKLVLIMEENAKQKKTKKKRLKGKQIKVSLVESPIRVQHQTTVKIVKVEKAEKVGNRDGNEQRQEIQSLKEQISQLKISHQEQIMELFAQIAQNQNQDSPEKFKRQPTFEILKEKIAELPKNQTQYVKLQKSFVRSKTELLLSQKMLEENIAQNDFLNEDLLLIVNEKEEILRQLKLKEIESIDILMQNNKLNKELQASNRLKKENTKMRFRIAILDQKYNREKDFYGKDILILKNELEETHIALKLKEIEKTSTDLELFESQKEERKLKLQIKDIEKLEQENIIMRKKFKQHEKFYDQDLKLLTEEKEQLIHSLKNMDIQQIEDQLKLQKMNHQLEILQHIQKTQINQEKENTSLKQKLMNSESFYEQDLHVLKDERESLICQLKLNEIEVVSAQMKISEMSKKVKDLIEIKQANMLLEKENLMFKKERKEQDDFYQKDLLLLKNQLEDLQNRAKLAEIANLDETIQFQEVKKQLSDQKALLKENKSLQKLYTSLQVNHKQEAEFYSQDLLTIKNEHEELVRSHKLKEIQQIEQNIQLQAISSKLTGLMKAKEENIVLKGGIEEISKKYEQQGQFYQSDLQTLKEENERQQRLIKKNELKQMDTLLISRSEDEKIETKRLAEENQHLHQQISDFQSLKFELIATVQDLQENIAMSEAKSEK